MLQFVDKAGKLTLQGVHLPFALGDLLLLLLKLILFLIDLTIEVFGPVEGLTRLKLECSDLGGELLTLMRGLLILHVQTLNLLQIIHIALS